MITRVFCVDCGRSLKPTPGARFEVRRCASCMGVHRGWPERPCATCGGPTNPPPDLPAERVRCKRCQGAAA